MDLYECPDCGKKMRTEYYPLGRPPYCSIGDSMELEESYIYCEECDKDQTKVIEDRMFDMVSDKY